MYNTYNNISFKDEHITLKQIEPLPWSNNAFEFTISNNSKTLTKPIWYSHLTLLALLKTDFNSILDIGAGDGMASWIFKFLDKDVTSIEPSPGPRLESFPNYVPDYRNDYMNIKFSKKFDAIWCSHVLEHVRNPGSFLDKNL